MRNTIAKDEQKLDFVVFPENFLGRVDHEGEFDFEKNYLLFNISKAIKKHGVYVVLGSLIEITPEKKVYCTSVLINRFGEKVGIYRKRKHPDDDGKLSVGDSPGIFKTEFGIVAIMICYDVENKEFLNETLLYKPRIIFNPIFIPNHSKVTFSDWKIKLRSLSGIFDKVAFDNKITIVRADQRNIGIGHGCSGTSQIMTPYSTERSSGYSDSILFAYVDKEADKLTTFNDITLEPEKNRSLDQDNVESRYSIDNFKFNSDFQQISFFKQNLIVELDTKNHLMIFNYENHEIMESLYKIESFQCDGESLWVQSGTKIYEWKGENKFEFSENSIAWTVINGKFVLSNNAGEIFIDKKSFSLSKHPIHSFTIINDYVICKSIKNEIVLFNWKEEIAVLKCMGKLYDYNEYNGIFYYIDENDELHSYDVTNDSHILLCKIGSIITGFISLNERKFIIISGDKLNLMRLIDIYDGDSLVIYDFHCHSSEIQQIKFDGKNHLLTASKDGIMKLFEFESNRIAVDLRKFFK